MLDLDALAQLDDALRVEDSPVVSMPSPEQSERNLSTPRCPHLAALETA